MGSQRKKFKSVSAVVKSKTVVVVEDATPRGMGRTSEEFDDALERLYTNVESGLVSTRVANTLSNLMGRRLQHATLRMKQANWQKGVDPLAGGPRKQLEGKK